ncbi:MAG TPA: hypothetical protein VG943_07875 [Caulobacterales bacterium]|nr:hypothetical protein [Caulobacterales bacterium]
MIGLFFSELILYLIAAIAGFAIGWRLRVHAASLALKAAERDVDSLRAALSEAQVRRAARAA